MAPIGSRHFACVNWLNELPVKFAQRRHVVSVQNPVRLDRRSERQRDLTPLKRRPDFYEGSPPIT